MRGGYTTVDSPPSPAGRKPNKDKGKKKGEDDYEGNSHTGCFYCESFNGHHRGRYLVLKLLTVVFIALVLLYSLDAFYPGGSFVGPQTLSLSETRLIPISNVWQSSVSAGDVELQDQATLDKKDGEYVRMLKFRTKPELSVVESWSYQANRSISIGNYTYWYRYFHSGSTVNVTFNFSKPINAYLIGGEHALTTFESEGGPKLKDHEVPPPRLKDLIDKGVEIGSNLTWTFNYTIKKDDIYWIIFCNSLDHLETSEGYYYLNVTNRLFNISEHTESCVLPCSLSVSYKSPEVLILHTPPLKSWNGTLDSGFVFTIHENRRNNITLAYFCVPMGILALVCVLMVLWDLSKMYACGFVWPTKSSGYPRAGLESELITNHSKRGLHE